MPSDKTLRGKYVFLTMATALEKLRQRPSRRELEEEVAYLQGTLPPRSVPSEDLYPQTGLLLGRLAGMAYKIIHNYELRDYADRKASESA